MFLEISQNSQENNCARVSFLIKLQAWGLFHKTIFGDCFLLAEMFYSDIYLENTKNIPV